MIFDYVIYLLVSILSAVASYYLTSNVYFLIIVLSVFFLYFVTYEIIFKRKERKILKRNKDLTTFIHDFFLLYNVDFSLDHALEGAQKNVSKELKEQIKMLAEFKSRDQLERLSDYFSSSLYQLFLKTIDLASQNQDEQNKLISFLLEENNRYVFNLKTLQKNIVRSLTEFSLLWVVSFLVLIILRFAINNYFMEIKEVWFYLVGIGLYFFFFLFSVYLFMQATRRSIKRYEQ